MFSSDLLSYSHTTKQCSRLGLLRTINGHNAYCLGAISWGQGKSMFLELIYPEMFIMFMSDVKDSSITITW